jgi:hypothetical protein
MVKLPVSKKSVNSQVAPKNKNDLKRFMGGYVGCHMRRVENVPAVGWEFIILIP